jgi:hypothetical protein
MIEFLIFILWITFLVLERDASMQIGITLLLVAILGYRRK